MDDHRDVADVRFGRALATARKFEGLTQARLGRDIGRSDSHISNVESGRRAMDPADVRAADKRLGAKGRLVRLYKELKEQGTVDWLENLGELQAEAEIIREWHPWLIPGLLQTEGYARAIIAATGPWLTPESVEATVRRRLRNSERVLGQPTPHYHVVIDDAAIMRPVGEPDVMAAQLRTLVDRVKEGRVMIQAHPFHARPNAGLGGPFSLLSSPTAPDTLHVESTYRGQQADAPQAVREFTMTFMRVQASARTPQETVDYLHRMIEEYERG
ncbi:helix-turn-helix domain-containing protein [Streptomonospora nanhaiensis]|uniref:helix-turn-helix domain-containing protein n=1 Tax=Streptomonospora nanhaiensis TaxID=1323731 RepID=UPI001C384AF5|nr:helix-turn-helix transcriptional regulator [Streptomonospora nanhaiensis]MBV2366357.1 helix-turn-helix domain-containing protein [Streptomonospora nanhaiensis]